MTYNDEYYDRLRKENPAAYFQEFVDLSDTLTENFDTHDHQDDRYTRKVAHIAFSSVKGAREYGLSHRFKPETINRILTVASHLYGTIGDYEMAAACHGELEEYTYEWSERDRLRVGVKPLYDRLNEIPLQADRT